MSKKVKSRKLAKRARQFEVLERRELMASDFSPQVKGILAGMYFTNQAAYESQGLKLQAAFGSGGGGGSRVAGENSAPFNTNEVEPNNVIPTANFLPLGMGASQNSVVNVGGQMQNTFDEDFYAFDLKKGDILDVRANVAITSPNPGVILFNSAGTELIYSSGLYLANAGTGASKSPRFNDGSTTLTYVIDTDGRYFLRVGDATGAYSLNLRTYRSTYEQAPIGTNQVLFLDFDGALLRNDLINLAPAGTGTTFRAAGLANYATQLGITQAQVPQLIDRITATVENKLKTMLGKNGNHGLYPETGNPGDFNITVLSSNNSPDVWGQANVSRVVIGGDSTTVPGAGGGLLGIAQRVDIGNFDHEDTALVMLDILIASATETDPTSAFYIPRSGNTSNMDLFVELAAMVIAHEAGHTLGGVHQDPNNNIFGIMDQFYDPIISSGAGRDGIFGTPDDSPLQFINDAYAPTTGVISGGGVDNSAPALAFGMSTGLVGATVSGISFNDKNRNGSQDAATETGIAGWEVFADINNNGVRDAGEPKTVADANGRYALRTAPGTYNIRITRPSGWIASINSELVKTVTVVAGATATANFGSFLPAGTATGFKWLDINGDGIRDTTEPPLAGVYIYLDLDGDARPDIGEPASITKADGSYSLVPPTAGTYSIREVVDAGYIQTFPASGSHVVTYDGSTPLRGYDFGNQESADWGDAPSPYPTTRAQNGAAHGNLPGLRLGTNWDAEQDGNPSANATGDDTVGLIGTDGTTLNDEDGVRVLTPIVRGDSSNIIQVNVTNTTGSPAYLQAWIDFNGNGSWTDAGEQIATNVAVVNGSNRITFTTPTNAVNTTFARFRLSQDQNLASTGKSKTGEVEDYQFNIVTGPRTLLQPDTFTVARNSSLNALDVLANDFALPDDPWTITAVSAGTQGGRVTIDAGGKGVKYTPALSYIGKDTFTYTTTSLTGRVEKTTVSVNVTLQFIDPFAVDDSFDVPTNSIGYPLSVLANDIEGKGGSLVVNSVSTPNKGGTVTIGSGGQSIRYTPARGFGGTEQFTYTTVDGTGKSSTANITVHTLQGDRTDDEVEFSFQFLNSAGVPVTAVRQGDAFQVVVSVDDLRPEKAALETPPRNITDPGVYSAYLDLLYSSGLVTPNATAGGKLDFSATFVAPYQTGINGSAKIPGLIDELGAFIGNVSSFDKPDKLTVAVLNFTATSAGIAEFVGDPADVIPGSEVTFYNSPNSRVSTEQIRYGRSTLEIVPNGVNFPFAVDDSRFNIAQGNAFNVNVLTNDITGTQPPIRISAITQPANGQTTINNNGTPNVFTDDTVTYVSNSNFVGVDQFTYQITDDRGFVSTATVTMHVVDPTNPNASNGELIKLRLDATDLAGVPITQIAVGSQFQLRGYVEDLRSGVLKPGVFAAFQDVLYDSGLVSVNPSVGGVDPGFQVVYASEYSNGKSGDVRIPGLINEIGSVQTSSDNTGAGEKLQFIVTLTARNTGVANFLGDPADIKPFHDSLVFDPTTPLTKDQIKYISDSITIVAGAGGSGSSGGEGNTNLLNPYDVNNDGSVSPIDVLILVNSMNTGNSGLLGSSGGNVGSGESGSARFFLDVNGDNYLSPLDALMVINQLNSSRNGNGEGEGSSSPLVVSTASSASAQSVLVEVPFVKKTSNNAVNYVYGPLPSSKDIDSILGEMVGGSASADESDYLDGIASDVFLNAS